MAREVETYMEHRPQMQTKVNMTNLVLEGNKPYDNTKYRQSSDFGGQITRQGPKTKTAMSTKVLD